MTLDQLDDLSEDDLVALMRREGLPVRHSMVACIVEEGDDIREREAHVRACDLERWRRELAEHFAAKRVN